MPSAEIRTRLDTIHDKILNGERIDRDDALLLHRHEELTALGVLADLVRRRKHDDGVVTYMIDRNINYTNVCNAFCTFCAFYRAPNHDEGYTLPIETIEQKIRETYELGGNQILLQGGHNPKLKIDWYESLFRRLKSSFPDLWLHALSPPEIVHIYKSSRIELPEALERLRSAGLDSIPGGGAEILVDRVREELATNKCSSQEWLDVMETQPTVLESDGMLVRKHFSKPVQGRGKRSMGAVCVDPRPQRASQITLLDVHSAKCNQRLQ